MRKTILIFIASVCFAGPRIWAQEKEPELDPVTITTSMSPEKISRTGRNIFVIKGERFSMLPVHSVDELLRYLPGIEVQARGPMGAQSDIVLRGGTFQQVLVLLDGVRVNDPNTGHFTSYIPISPREIDRIEVLKGASSAVYGSEAVGGVIHIITKTFAASQHNNTRSDVGAQIAAGAYDLFTVDAGGFYSNGKTSVAGGLLSNNTSGQQQRGTRGSVYAHTGSLSFAQRLGDAWEIKLRSSYDSRQFSAQNFYTNFISDTAHEKVKTFWNQVAFVHTGDQHTLSLNAGYKDLEDTYRFNSVAVANKSKSKLLQALFTDEWKAGLHTGIVSGVQFINKKISSNDRGDHNVRQAAAFAVLNQQVGANFFMSPAMRLEWNERSGWEFVPQINLSYRQDKFQLRGSAGKTIRDADFTERFNNYQKTFVASGRIGDPDLKAERSFSYEAGADYFAGKSVRLSGTFFQRFHTKLIDYVVTPYSEMPRKVNLSPTGTYALAKNISSVTTTGVETELQYSKQLARNNSFWASVGVTWLESKSSEATPSFYISSHARFLSSFNVHYNTGRFAFAVNGLYKDRQKQIPSVAIAKLSSSYFMMNVKAEAFLIKKRLSVFMEADNVFDERYADLLGAQMPGRWLMGGLKISLSK